MATAAKVVECERNQLDWLTIEDDTGAIWRYARRGALGLDSIAHVAGEYQPPEIRAVLVRDADGIALLRQESPGLPEKMVVDHITPTSGSHLPTSGFWRGKVEYEREPLGNG